jgi:hypothetical protein
MTAPSAAHVADDPAERTLYTGETWRDYIARQGLEWDDQRARVAGSVSDLAKMIRERDTMAAKREGLPVYDGPPTDEIRRRAETATTTEDLQELRALQDLAAEVKYCHSRGMKYYRDTMIGKYAPVIGESVAGELVDFTVAELEKAAGVEQAENDATAAAALAELEAKTPEELARMDSEIAAQRRRLDAEHAEQQKARERRERRVTLPAIQVNGRQLREVAEDALAAMEAANVPPRTFIRAGAMTRIGRDEDARPMIQLMNEHQVRYELVHAANFEKRTTHPARNEFGLLVRDENGKVKVEEKIVSVSPPIEAVRTVMADPRISTTFPPLRAIIEAPTIRPDGGLVISPGYDEASGLYYAPSPGLEVPEIPDDPAPEQVAAAAEIVKDTICDFPYVDTASTTNAIGALLTPILRGMISGPVPLALLDKPQSGTGASLLAEVVALVATGTAATMETAPERADEWSKTILSCLLTGRSIVIFDNIEGRFYAPALAIALSSTVYGGRVLGRSEDVSISHRVSWFATGINIQLSGDLPRRCYWVRMDAKSARPWTDRPKGFKHPKLKEWTVENRGRIIAAILTLARAWLHAGKPAPENPVILGGYESWCEVVGGVLAFAGFEKFLDNLEDLYSEADADAPQWANFLEKWYEIWKSPLAQDGQAGATGAITVNILTKYLQEVASSEALDESLLGALPEEVAAAYSRPTSFTRVLGAALRHRNGMRFTNGYYLERLKETKKNALQWVVHFDPDLVVS